MNTKQRNCERGSRFWERKCRFWKRIRGFLKHAALGLALATGGAYAEEVDYDALFSAIAQVESDNGLTSSNKYQLTRTFLRDVERISGEKWDWSATVADDGRARLSMRLYWAYYAPRWAAKSGGDVTAELLAKLHRVGYVGLSRKAVTAERYWLRVKRRYKPKKSSFSGLTP